jgi:hypothetical protein
MLNIGYIRPRFPRISDQFNQEMDSVYEQLIDMAGSPNREGKLDIIEGKLVDINQYYISEIREYIRLIRHLMEHHVARTI